MLKQRRGYNTSAGPPTSGFHEAGARVVDADGAVWVCVADGDPGTFVDSGTISDVPSGASGMPSSSAATVATRSNVARGSGTMQWVVADTLGDNSGDYVIAAGEAGDAFPRVAMATDGRMYFGDGTFDPITDGFRVGGNPNGVTLGGVVQVPNNDVEIVNINKGVVLTDRTTGLHERVFIDNGVIGHEAAPEYD